MLIPSTITRLLCCALLMMTVSCGPNGLKFPKFNLMSAFKQKTDDGNDSIAENGEDPEAENAVTAPSKARNGSSGSSSPKKSSDTASLGSTDLDLDPLDMNGGNLPVIVRPRQPAVEITPPTKGGKPLPDIAAEEAGDDDKGGLRPRNPTLEIVPPGRP